MREPQAWTSTSAADPFKMKATVSKNATPAAEVSQNAGFAFPRWARSLFFHAPRPAWEAIFRKSQHFKDEEAKLKTARHWRSRGVAKNKKTHPHAGPEAFFCESSKKVRRHASHVHIKQSKSKQIIWVFSEKQFFEHSHRRGVEKARIRVRTEHGNQKNNASHRAWGSYFWFLQPL